MKIYKKTILRLFLQLKMPEYLINAPRLGSGYPLPGRPEPDRNFFAIPEPDRNQFAQNRNRTGTGLKTGGYPEYQKGTNLLKIWLLLEKNYF